VLTNACSSHLCLPCLGCFSCLGFSCLGFSCLGFSCLGCCDCRKPLDEGAHLLDDDAHLLDDGHNLEPH
jgi:hypothetical protein